MSKTIEVPDIAQYEENDSELAKKNIIELSSNIKYHIDFNKKLIDEITRLNMIIDIKNKRIDELNKRLDKKGERIDKAIEYIRNNCILSNEWTDLDFCNFVPTGNIKYKQLTSKKVKYLLDIFRGNND